MEIELDSTVWIDLLKLGVVVLLVLANGFFVAAEFSLVSVRRTRIAELVSHGNASAEAVQKAIENPDRVIAATQLGITLASLSLGWIGEPALAHLIQPLVNLFPNAIQTEAFRPSLTPYPVGPIRGGRRRALTRDAMLLSVYYILPFSLTRYIMNPSDPLIGAL